MKIKQLRLVDRLNPNRLGLLVFLVLGLVTVAMIMVSQGIVTMSLLKPAAAVSGTVQLSGKLSQNKLVQGGHNTVFLDVTVKSPVIKNIIDARQSTDMIIVLDRSGSMSGAKKMPYAKAAIRDVLSRLNANDRFALVSFSDHAVLHSPLVTVNPGEREDLYRIVNSISANGGTNISDGLNSALQIMANNRSDRARRVLLLSDGQANQGIVSTAGLSSIVSNITGHGAVLSAFGMGLDFNETLMTKLADHGMGQYAYLEDLSGLGQILASDLKDTRNIYASGSSLDIQLADGVKIQDAGGYPITRINASTIRITTGQLLANTEKQFVMTFSVPNDHVGTVSLGSIQLNYQQQGEAYQVVMHDESVALSVIEPERQEEALSSIDKNVYKQSWMKNNLGRMQKKLSQWVREGKKDKAEQVLHDYRASVESAEKESNIALVSPEMDDVLKEMQGNIEEAFSGSRSDQDIKRKRAAKSIQADAIKAQRTVN